MAGFWSRQLGRKLRTAVKRYNPVARNVKPCEIGERFGRLVVSDKGIRDADGRFRHTTRCDCGGTIKAKPSELRTGRYVSCGCQNREKLEKGMHRTHGHWDGRRPSPEWNAWHHAIDRCTNPNNPKYHHWGGRGIKVCQRWLDSFDNFLADMGAKPRGRVLDRQDNDGHYEPTNCRWATLSESNRNRRPFVRTKPK